ncbi:MAG: ribonuclease D [Gammaproteobacteria bacterium]|nr:MAG: ribonuclease D [Gammaproteobacteria bacterium]
MPSVSPYREIEFIDSDDALKSVCDHFSHEPVIAIDTEFQRQNTYFPKLCLIQIASSTSVVCIDPFAITDTEPLCHLLQDPAITKVFHSCQQDLEVLFLYLDILPENLFDTQIAAQILGMGRQLGYANLVRELLSLELEKSQTRTDWTQRPLHPDQLQYAAEDVVPLYQIHDILHRKLVESDQLAELQQQVRERLNREDYIVCASNGVKRLKGLNRVTGPARKLAKIMAVWREQQAIDQNRPRQWILKDGVLIALARQFSQGQAAKINNDRFRKRYERHAAAVLQFLRQHEDAAKLVAEVPVTEESS